MALDQFGNQETDRVRSEIGRTISKSDPLARTPGTPLQRLGGDRADEICSTFLVQERIVKNKEGREGIAWLSGHDLGFQLCRKTFDARPIANPERKIKQLQRSGMFR